MSLETFAKAIGIDWTRTAIAHGDGPVLRFEFDIMPTEFLRFAHQDFQYKGKRGLINALTNAKRAIDCQSDGFLTCFGYEPNSDLPQNEKDYIKRRAMIQDNTALSQRLQLLRALEVAPAGLI